MDELVSLFEALLEAAQVVANCSVVICGLIPDPTSRVFDRLMAKASDRIKLSARTRCAIFVDVRKKMLDSRGNPVPNLFAKVLRISNMTVATRLFSP